MDQACSRNDVLKQAFGYRATLTTYAYASLGDWAQAEDCVQEAYLVVLDKWQEYRPEAGIYPWVRRMVRLKTLERLRARRREVAADPELAELVAAAADEHLTEAVAVDNDRRVRLLQSCLQGLDREGRELIERFYFSSRSCEDIAAGARASANAIWIRLSRLRKRLRACVERRIQLGEGLA